VKYHGKALVIRRVTMTEVDTDDDEGEFDPLPNDDEDVVG
jgi:hypothetical protein